MPAVEGTPALIINSSPNEGNPITYTTALPAHLPIILALQAQTLPSALTPAEIAATGFVTVQHTLDILTRMNEAAPAIIGIDRRQSVDGAETTEIVTGYTLMMPISFASEIPILEETVSKAIAGKLFRGHPIVFHGESKLRWFIMGQVLVAPAYRGTGVFDAMYRALRERYMHEYDFVLTEVSSKNPRSLRAHLRVGFTELSRHASQDANGETFWWHCVLWDWSLPGEPSVIETTTVSSDVLLS